MKLGLIKNCHACKRNKYLFIVPLMHKHGKYQFAKRSDNQEQRYRFLMKNHSGELVQILYSREDEGRFKDLKNPEAWANIVRKMSRFGNVILDGSKSIGDSYISKGIYSKLHISRQANRNYRGYPRTDIGTV